MSSKMKNALILFFVMAIVVFYSVSIIKKKSDRKKIYQSYKFNTATILKVKFPFQGVDYILYSYYVNGILYKGTYQLGTRRDQFQYHKLIGENWPMVYDTTDFDNSKLLLVKQDYNGFDIDQKHIKYINF